MQNERTEREVSLSPFFHVSNLNFNLFLLSLSFKFEFESLLSVIILLSLQLFSVANKSLTPFYSLFFLRFL